MKIRDAVVADADSVCTVLRRSITELCTADHHDDPAILGAWLGNKTPALVGGWITHPGNSILIAIDDDRIIGVAGVTDKGEITLNYVSPDARFRGISRALLQAAERRAQERGNTRCRLTSTETAHRFYLSAGYADDAARSSSGGYTMSRDLPRE